MSSDTTHAWSGRPPAPARALPVSPRRLLLLAACPAWAQAGIKKGGSLVVAIQDNPPHLLTGISVDILDHLRRPDRSTTR